MSCLANFQSETGSERRAIDLSRSGGAMSGRALPRLRIMVGGIVGRACGPLCNLDDHGPLAIDVESSRTVWPRFAPPVRSVATRSQPSTSQAMPRLLRVGFL